MCIASFIRPWLGSHATILHIIIVRPHNNCTLIIIVKTHILTFIHVIRFQPNKPHPLDKFLELFSVVLLTLVSGFGFYNFAIEFRVSGLFFGRVSSSKSVTWLTRRWRLFSLCRKIPASWGANRALQILCKLLALCKQPTVLYVAVYHIYLCTFVMSNLKYHSSQIEQNACIMQIIDCQTAPGITVSFLDILLQSCLCNCICNDILIGL